MLQQSILCMHGTQYATKRSILCRGAFCGPTARIFVAPIDEGLRVISSEAETRPWYSPSQYPKLLSRE